MPKKKEDAPVVKRQQQEEKFHNPTIIDRHAIPAPNSFYNQENIWISLPDGYGLPEGVTYTLAHLDTLGPLVILGGVPAIKSVVEKVVEMLRKINPGLTINHSLGAGTISSNRIRKFVQGQNAIKNLEWEQNQRRLLDHPATSEATRVKLLQKSPSDEELTTGTEDSPNIGLWYAVFGSPNGWLRHTREVNRIQIINDRNRGLFLKPGSMQRLAEVLEMNEKVKQQLSAASTLGKDNASENDQDGDNLQGEDTLAQE
jgi:hypothetical protein